MAPSVAKKEYAALFFGKLVELESNLYWKEVFEKCCVGKLPKKCNLRRDGKILYLTNPRGISSQILLQGDPKEMLVVLKETFKQHCKMSSPEDNEDNCKRLEDSKGKAEKVDWGSWKKIIKKKDVIQSILMNHVALLAHRYELTIEEQAEVYRVLSVAVSLGQVTEDDVKFNKKGILTRIRNFSWDDINRKGWIEYCINKKSVQAKVPKKAALSVAWQQYLTVTVKRKRNVS